MNPELQKYYEERFSTMATEGWRDLMEDVDKMIEPLNNISTIADEKSLQFRKGELSILIWLKNLKQVSERAFEDLNEKNV
jgi:crotonobetainyl-CoA:carnitine CoA-transferase CaiB-like acyl-CoA transferase